MYSGTWVQAMLVITENTLFKETDIIKLSTNSSMSLSTNMVALQTFDANFKLLVVVFSKTVNNRKQNG